MNTGSAKGPIGVFDSGIGGLSILRALRTELPHERFVYFADTGHAPYGERTADFVRARSQTIARQLRAEHGIKALVMACNTATAAAIAGLRAQHPDLPIVGVEPALRPAVLASQSRRIGVLATRGTLASAKFAQLLDELKGQAQFVLRACDGLAQAIENATQAAPGPTGTQAMQQVHALCQQHVSALGPLGAAPETIDTLVLGCTHYIFAASAIQAVAGPQVRLIETGQPVARHTRQVLERAGLLATQHPESCPAPLLLSSGHPQALQAAAQVWLSNQNGHAQGVAA